MNLVKKQLRDQMKVIRAEAFSKEEKAVADERIGSFFAGRFSVSGWLFAYDAFGFETGTESIITSWLKEGGKVALPRMEGPGKMVFYPWNGKDPLEKHAFGMREPLRGQVIIPDKGSILLVPALGFDLQGGRLGYGGGFYDAYLNQYGNETVKVGLCYEKQILKNIPVDERDMPVDMIITEERVWEITS